MIVCMISFSTKELILSFRNNKVTHIHQHTLIEENQLD